MKSEWIKNRETGIKKLNRNLECDVLIVGAGMSGLLCAYQLQDMFEHIVIIESDEIAGGASGRNTGKITSQHGLNYQEILKIHGEEKTRLYYQENEKAILEIKGIIEKYDIDCEYSEKEAVVGCKSVYMTKKIADEIKAYDTCLIPYEIVRENEIEGIRYGAKFMKQASFDPYQFCIQLASRLTCEIYERTPMMHIHDHVVKTKDHTIRFQHCILATQVMPFQFKFFYTLTAPKQSYLAALKPSDKKNVMILSEDEITKTKNDMKNFMFIGGYDHALSDDSNIKWQSFKRDLVLEYPNHRLLSTWSSQDYQVTDYLPIVDRCDDFIVITGFNKWGNTNAYVASLTVKDILKDEMTKRRELFSLKRKSLVFSKNFITENYQVLKSLIESKMHDSKLMIPDNHQAVSFQLDRHPYGIYRQDDKLYIVDTLCPHLGCTLKFNEHDKCWDCPCHGSRFSLTGEIIKGPASVGLHHSECLISELKLDK